MFNNKRIKALEERVRLLESVLSDVYDWLFDDYKKIEDIKRHNNLRWAFSKLRFDAIENALPAKKVKIERQAH